MGVGGFCTSRRELDSRSRIVGRKTSELVVERSWREGRLLRARPGKGEFMELWAPLGYQYLGTNATRTPL